MIDWRGFAIGLAIVSVVAFVVSKATGIPFVPTFVIALVALLINGFVATLEDDLPGGFNNPDGTDTPAYVGRVKAVGRWGRWAIVVLGAAIALALGGIWVARAIR